MLPEEAAGCSEGPAGKASTAQLIDGFITPEELRKCVPVRRRVILRGADHLEIDTVPLWDGLNDPPPRRHNVEGFLCMDRPDHKRDLVECPTIDLLLRWQPIECIVLAFDLIPRERAVDDGHVDTHLTLTESKLFDDESIRVAVVEGSQLLPESLSNVDVPHRHLLGR